MWTITHRFFLKNNWIHSPGVYRTFKSDQYLCILLISSLEMHPWLHNNYLKSLTHGHWTHITLRFLLKNYWKLCLFAHTTFKSHWILFILKFLAWNIQPLSQKMHLKIRSEPHIWKIKMADLLLLLGIAQSHTSEISCILVFRVFSARLWRIFENVMSLQWGFPPKLGNPPENAIFGRFRLVMCIPITKLNVTIPVLFKTSI